MNKVCHIISGYYRIDARVFQRQCKSLLKYGFEVSVLTNDGEPEEIIEGIKFYSCELTYNTRIKTMLNATKQFIKKAQEIDADVYQLHSPELFNLGLKLKKLGKIVIYDAHEDLPRHIQEKEWLPKYFRKPVSYFVEMYMDFVLKRYDYIITPHSHVVESLKHKIKNIELIANFPLVKQLNNFSFEEYLKRDNIICYTGTVYPYSNQELLVSVLKSFDNLKYDIAGFIDNNLLINLKNNDINNKINFHGRIIWDELPKFYQNATIGYVLYDYKLNLGYKLGSYGTNKIFEYMEEGLPFICTDYLLWKKICDIYKCGLYVEPGNKEQLYNAVNFLINNKFEAFEMGQNGKKAVKDVFNWTTEESKYIKIFKSFNN
jgi:glycosyltransferase involved in cell wall biosynthesis